MNSRLWLPALILVPTSVYFIIEESIQLHLVSIYRACACYPRLGLWGYALDGLAFFLLLNIPLLPIWFSRTLSRQGTAMLVAIELFAYGFIFLVGVANLSTTHQPPNWAVLNLLPVAVVFAFGYLLRMIGGSWTLKPRVGRVQL